MSKTMVIITLFLTAVGYACLGVLSQQSRIAHWKLTCIRLEHELARLQNRKPRELNDL